MSKEEAFLMCNSNKFHNLGVATAEAPSPRSLCCVLGTSDISWSADLSDRERSSERYGGARPFKDLKTNKRTPKWRSSQCSEDKTGVMCSPFRVAVQRRAATFWTS